MAENAANKRLMQAAYDGNLSAIEEALKNGAQINARAEYGDTALNEAAEHGHLEVVKRLLEAGADIENKGGADKTPIMNAAFAGHVEIVRFFLEKGAKINNDLLSSVQMKVNILEENAEAGMVRPEAVEAWKGFLEHLVTARIKQDIPEMVKTLSSSDVDERKYALEALTNAAQRGIDISSAISALKSFESGTDETVRTMAQDALKAAQARPG